MRALVAVLGVTNVTAVGTGLALQAEIINKGTQGTLTKTLQGLVDRREVLEVTALTDITAVGIAALTTARNTFHAHVLVDIIVLPEAAG